MFAFSPGTASVQLDCTWVTHMIQQELLTQLSLTLLSCAPGCSSWHMPLQLVSMGLSLGHILPGGRARAACRIPAAKHRGADCASSESPVKRKLPSELYQSSHRPAPVALGIA